ncbi:MAG: DUF533 domain-containing protein [Pseudomonadota bacterium]
MSLMKTLAKVAVGVAIAKGASHLMKNKGDGTSNAGLGGMLGGLAGGAGGSGGLQGMLGGLTGGGGANLQNMLGGLMGGAQGGGGGLGGLLDGLQSGNGGSGAGLQDMLGGLAGAGAAGGLLGGLASTIGQRPDTNDASFGAVLNSAFDETPQQEIEPTADQEAAAALMLKAMIQAAKSDGKLDDAEQEKLMGHVGSDGIDAEEAEFLRTEMAAPIDIPGLVNATPDGLAPQVYAMSVMAIDLDSQAEAQYLHQLADGFGMQPAQVNEIHTQLGVPTLYT